MFQHLGLTMRAVRKRRASEQGIGERVWEEACEQEEVGMPAVIPSSLQLAAEQASRREAAVGRATRHAVRQRLKKTQSVLRGGFAKAAAQATRVKAAARAAAKAKANAEKAKAPAGKANAGKACLAKMAPQPPPPKAMAVPPAPGRGRLVSYENMRKLLQARAEDRLEQLRLTTPGPQRNELQRQHDERLEIDRRRLATFNDVGALLCSQCATACALL